MKRLSSSGPFASMLSPDSRLMAGVAGMTVSKANAD
ncbi:hypothetical protein PF007_g30847 [Phytophthora fragariae]|uniref:Uncharacterized protein n=1 Tax=Phytophthora fragariae TaxID=53985 RepID=A0A6A3D9L7_9STRA|nr:hypothetical protein PF009_g31409 [Phytophthora fragariae]KAE9059749.1 hypothetical protein PF007_g30847 [Phytophthora fragariae]KAE9062646.1 hypothetical protein PF006_g31121 [Phytophthora fragariae]KAE9264964.1 hypothetical protein PF001_g31078 [Phytophthora fragariae]KAE9268834.1 hypothetical protein PF008_g31022 [Phytophthora fragariae]